MAESWTQAAPLTKNQIKYKEVFLRFVTNDVDVITRNDFRTVLGQLQWNRTEVQIQKMLNELDSEGQDKIQLADFLKLMYKREKHRTDTNWMDAFRVYDPDGTGIISVAKFFTVMSSLRVKFTEDQRDQVIAQVRTQIDLSKDDGQINYIELAGKILADLFQSQD